MNIKQIWLENFKSIIQWNSVVIYLESIILIE